MKDMELDELLKRKIQDEKAVDINVREIISKGEIMKRKNKIKLVSIAASVVVIVLVAVFAITSKMQTKKTEVVMVNNLYLGERTDSILDIMYSGVDFKRIDELPENYSVDDAIAEGALVTNIRGCFNSSAYYEFLEKYNNREDAYLRYVTTTVEGDVCITDTKYDKMNDKVYVIRDDTRDKFSASIDQRLKFYSFDNITEVDYTSYDSLLKSSLLAHNGEFKGLPRDDSSIFIAGVK